MNRSGLKCVIYVRVSTEMQVDGFSLEAQKNVVKRFAEREEMIVLNIYEDAGKSGKSIEGRPAFQKMLEDIKNGLEINYILVYKLSRFGRNAADILNSIEFIQSYDINLIATDEGIDSSQTSGKLLISVLSAVSEIERENILEQTMNGRKEKARQGGWNGGFAPYGYKLINGKLEVVLEEAETIKQIFEMYTSSIDKGCEYVARQLNLLGIKKIKNPNSQLDYWSGSTIREILSNPIYAGQIAFGRRKKEKIKGTKNEYRIINSKEYIIGDGKHEAIIDMDLWNKAKEKKEKMYDKIKPIKNYKNIYLLTSILKCPICGSSMYVCRDKYKNAYNEITETFAYRCLNRYKNNIDKCNYTEMVKKERIDAIVINIFKIILNNNIFINLINEKLKDKINPKKYEDELKKYENKLSEVMQNKASLESEIDNLPIDINYREKILADLRKRLYSLYETIDELEKRIKDSDLKIKGVKKGNYSINKTVNILKDFTKIIDKETEEEKKKMLKLLIDKIVLKENLKEKNPIKLIEFRFPIDFKGENKSLYQDKKLDLILDCNSTIGESIFNEAVDMLEPKKKKTTYKDIQNYVENKYGFKVHTAYIAEVKRSHGVRMYDAPNAVEVLKNRKQHPTEKQVIAIEDALTHFEII